MRGLTSDDPAPSSDITMADATSSAAGGGSCSVRRKMDAGQTPFHPRGRAQCLDDVRLAPISAKGLKRVLSSVIAHPQLEEPLSLDVNLGPEHYKISVRFASGATSTFEVPL